MLVKTWLLLLDLFHNVESELDIYFQLVLKHETVARDFESSNRNATGV